MADSGPLGVRMPTASDTATVAFEVVALAASAGGLRALSQVLGGLPTGFPAALVVVQHLDPHHPSHLAEILNHRTPLHVKEAEEGDRLSHGVVQIAPPDRHLLVRPDGTLELSRAEAVHFSRPSADLLFESLAVSFGPRAVAVVLSGSGSDGDRGVRAVKARGGFVIAQNAASSEFFGMPGSAIRSGVVDRVLPLDDIAPALVSLLAGAIL